MIARLERFLRRWRRRLSRSEWLIRWLNLSLSEGTAGDAGIVIIQIDGLSRHEMDRAMARGRLPFLKKLIARQHYRVHSHYSGLPSSTPAVQAELFYGVRTAVPAFSFFDRRCGRVFRMFDAPDALEVEQRLSAEKEGLLQGGSSYSNIYTGGAMEAHFCAASMGWDRLFENGSPFSIPLFLLVHLRSFLRTAGLIVIETVLAIADAMRGLIAGQNLWRELKFIPARVGITILARELIVAGVSIDVARGLPVIHCNLLGFDEQAHRRGPSSAFAHWGLKGIDDAVKRIWGAAHRSARRHYEVWIFSDHGQENTLSYLRQHGHSVQEAIALIHDEHAARKAFDARDLKGVQGQRARHFGWSALDRFAARSLLLDVEENPGQPLVTAMGPIGHVYWPQPLIGDERDAVARRMVTEANIPLVLAREDAGRARAWTASGTWLLPEQAGKILGMNHPLLGPVAVDLCALAHHPDAGQLVISGWRLDGRPLTFPDENGSHAGPGSTETEGFALLPADAPLPDRDHPWVRPDDLREAALRRLGRSTNGPPHAELPRRPPGDVLRVMTYNVHSCIGMDGRTSPERIARVIAMYDPDVVALQELDVGRARTAGIDQTQRIAQALAMEHHFHAALRLEEEQYGDALLSRLPMRLVQAGELPLPPRRPCEGRGALWATVEFGGMPIQLLNTHLGLLPREQQPQVAALLSERWLGHPDCQGAAILCGDFNALPGSRTFRSLARRLDDAQRGMHRHRPHNTFFGRYPLGRIDHILISPHFEVVGVQVARTMITRAASDHLPLIVDLRLKQAAPQPKQD